MILCGCFKIDLLGGETVLIMHNKFLASLIYIQDQTYTNSIPITINTYPVSGRMVVWYTVRAVLPSRVWVAEAHAPLETGESWFESSKTLTPHYSPGHVCDDVEGTQDSRGWLKCVPAADTHG